MAAARRRDRYPHDVDALLVAPFAIDLAGNLLNLFDTVSWWDDANHLVNWALLVAAAGRLLAHTRLDRLVRIGLAVGFGAVTATLWELGSTSRSCRTRPSSSPPTATPWATRPLG